MGTSRRSIAGNQKRLEPSPFRRESLERVTGIEPEWFPSDADRNDETALWLSTIERYRGRDIEGSISVENFRLL